MIRSELWYSVVVRDRDGKVISRERRKSNSFLKQWNQFVWYFHCSGTIYPIRTTGAATRLDSHNDNFKMNAGAGDASLGIVIGTSDTAVTINDYAMGAQIPEGAGVGQMNHLVQNFTSPVVSAPNCDYGLSRSIVNNSGGLITVKESGIYHRHCYRYGPHAGDFYFYSSCGARDVFATPQDVPNGGSITINYTLRVTA